MIKQIVKYLLLEKSHNQHCYDNLNKISLTEQSAYFKGKVDMINEILNEINKGFFK